MGLDAFPPACLFFFFFRRFTKPVCMGHRNTPQLAAQSNPCLEKKKKNNPRNHSGYITECIGTEFGRTQPSGCTSLNTPIPWHVCHRPPPPQQRLFCSAGLHRDSDLWPHRRRGTVELCRCHSVTTRTSGLALNGCDSVVDFCHPAHHA